MSDCGEFESTIRTRNKSLLSALCVDRHERPIADFPDHLACCDAVTRSRRLLTLLHCVDPARLLRGLNWHRNSKGCARSKLGAIVLILFCPLAGRVRTNWRWRIASAEAGCDTSLRKQSFLHGFIPAEIIYIPIPDHGAGHQFGFGGELRLRL